MVAIDDYGFLSDCHSAALVGRAGSVDWWCVPRFDSPSVFGRLLGADAGHWALSPTAKFEVERHYVPDTLVLRTAFSTSSGAVTVSDALGSSVGRVDTRSACAVPMSCSAASSAPAASSR